MNVELAKRSNRAGVTTSNAFELQVATATPPGRIATIVTDRLSANEPFPASGRVEVSRGPVVMFEY